MKQYSFAVIMLGSIGCMTPTSRPEPRPQDSGVGVATQGLNSKPLYQDPSGDQFITQPTGPAFRRIA